VAQPVVQAARRGRPGYDLAAVLTAAVEVFNERGYDGTSMGDIAARLGIAKSAIYHHVAGKEQLLSMSLDRALDGLSAIAKTAASRKGPAVERLEYLLRESVAELVRELPHVTLLLRVRGNTDVERAAMERRRVIDRTVARLVRQAQAEGDIKAGVEPTITAHLMFGVVNSIVEWYRPGRRDGADHLADAVCDLAFRGLRTDQPGSA
jgi:AcrR family transcriptional regulator